MGSIRNTVLLSLLLVGLVSPVLCRSLEEFNEKKNFFSFPTAPVGHSTPTPTHGTGGGPSTSTPSTPTYGTGGGHGTSTPSYGTGGGHGVSTPSTPSYGSGGHGSSTPTYGSGGNHATPTPSHGSGSYSPPSTGSGGHSTPTVPSLDPHHYFTGTCDYWRTHPQAINAIIGYLSTVGQTFGPTCGFIFGTGTTLHDALSNPRTDGFGSLIREGTAALLNSIASSHFPFTTHQVREAVVSAITSEGAATAQADLFKHANEGKYHA
ncbi:uncharacterized protein LOC144571271 isoform X2 [Carex rostrata]